MMKKTTKSMFLLGAIATLSTGAFAQRNCNISVSRMTSPAVNAMIPREGGTEIKFMLKNNGPNNMKIGDTIVYKHSLHEGAAVSLAFLTANLNNGDSVEISTGTSIISTVTGTADQDASICVQIFDINTAGITLNSVPVLVTYNDTDTTAASNLKCNNVKLKGGTTSVLNLSNKNEQLSFYPNPASAEVNFALSLEKAENVLVSVKDITGREVMHNDFGKVQAGEAPFKLNVANLTNGIYFIELTAGDRKAVGKMNVRH